MKPANLIQNSENSSYEFDKEKIKMADTPLKIKKDPHEKYTSRKTNTEII